MSKIDFMKQLGADEVINYKEADWADVLAGKDYDLIFDYVGTPEDWPKASKVLKKGGTFVSIANFGDVKSTEDHAFKVFLLKSNADDLTKLVALVKAGAMAFNLITNYIIPFFSFHSLLLSCFSPH